MKRPGLDEVRQILSVSREKTRALWNPLWEKLTYNLAEGVIAPVRVLSVSIEKGGVSIVYASRFMSRIRIQGSRYYSVEEGKYLQPERLAKTLSLSLDELKAKKVDTILSIPREWAIIRTVELPSTVKENLASVISYELDRLTPLAAENALYDFKVLDEKEGKLSIMVWAARKNLVSPYMEALQKEGIPVMRVTVGVAALGTLSHYLAKNQSPVFLAYDRFGYQGGLVVHGRVIAATGGVFDGADTVTRTDRVVADIAGLMDLAKGRNLSPKVLIYPGGKEQLALEQRIDSSVDVILDKVIQKTFSAEQGEARYSGAGGALEALWEKADPVNLLGKGFRKTKKPPLVITILLLLIIAGLVFLYMMVPLQRQERTIQEIDRQINSRKEEVKKAESLKKEIDGLRNDIATIQGFKDTKTMTLLLFKELTTLLPKTVWLTRTRITGVAVDIEGYAGSATEIISKLEGSPYLRKVEFASPTIRDTRLNADRFVIKMELESSPKTEGEGSTHGKKK